MLEDSFAAKNAPLFDLVRAARAAGDRELEQQTLEELLGAYRRLGERRTGTVEEQNAYIIARRLGALPEALAALGVKPEDLPAPAGRRSSPPPAATRTLQEAAERFALVGAAAEQPGGRFVVAYRPQDNKRYKGRLCPWAIVDTADGKPVAWYYDRDFAEVTADEAGRLRQLE